MSLLIDFNLTKLKLCIILIEVIILNFLALTPVIPEGPFGEQ